MTWTLYAFIATMALAGADICVKLASGKVSNSIGLLIYGSCTFLAGLGWVAWQRLTGLTLTARPEGVVAAVGVGICFATVVASLYLAFSAGAPISVASPVIRLGGLLLAGFVGLTLFREPITLRYVAGLVLSCAGIYLIITR